MSSKRRIVIAIILTALLIMSVAACAGSESTGVSPGNNTNASQGDSTNTSPGNSTNVSPGNSNSTSPGNSTNDSSGNSAGTSSGNSAGEAPPVVSEPLKGKSIDLIIPFSPGGGFDLSARLIAPFIEKYTGASVVPTNVEGAAGVIGSNQVYRARADGTTIANIDASANCMSQLNGQEGVQFDMMSYTIIGRLSTDDAFLLVSAVSEYNTLEKLLKAAETGADVIVLAEGAASAPFYRSVISVEVLGLTGARALTGYEGSSETNLAMLRGDGDLTVGTYTSRKSLIDDGDFIPLICLSGKRNSVFSDVPTIYEVNKDPANIPLIDLLVAACQLNRVVVGPPDMDEVAKAALREAFKLACEDPELLANAQQAGMPIVYLDPDGVSEMISAINNCSQEGLDRFNATMVKYVRD